MKISNDFDKIAKKTRRKNWVTIIFISVFITMLCLVVAFRVMTVMTMKSAEKIRYYYDVMHEIAYPNITYNTAIFEPTSQFSGYYYLGRVKDIDGTVSHYEDVNAPYGLLPRQSYMLQNNKTYIDMSKRSAYTYGEGYKSPVFFNKKRVDNKTTDFVWVEKTEDIGLLSQIPENAVEVAITFDKDYSFQEIEELVPDNLKINWYWIGSQTDYDITELSPEEQIGFELDPYLVRDGQIAENKDLKLVWEESFKKFIENTQIALDNDWISRSVSTSKGEIYSLKKDVKKYLKENPNAETAKFAGVILTGRAENFEQLKTADWIFASNIGQSVEIQPYHQLEK